MARIVGTKVDKKYVLSKVSQINIFSRYLNIDVELIQWCIDTDNHIKSPLRIDHKATCGFRYVKGKLKLKDFAGYFWGDCFDVVAKVISTLYNKDYNVNDKQDFVKILKHIMMSFKDIFYGLAVDDTFIENTHNALKVIRNKKPVIELVVRNWELADKLTWGKIRVTAKELNINFIYPVDQYYIDRNSNPEPKYYHSFRDPCYAYYLGKDSNNIDSIKLYFPKRDKKATRFIANSNHLEGILNLERGDYDIIIVTKSTKDRVALSSFLRRNTFLYGGFPLVIGVINIPHETYRVKIRDQEWLKSKLKDGGRLFSLMDNDRTGKVQAIYLMDEFAMEPILIPKVYRSKDFSELVDGNTDETIYNLTEKYITKISKNGKISNRKTKYRRNDGICDDDPF